jgi:tetratricopeptide (TPR) repeat protein
MAWLNLFSGPTAEKLEQKGDALAAAGFWGEAKLEYERACLKLEKATVLDRDSLIRLKGKIAATKEALARNHHRHAAELADIGDFNEALDLVELALELTDDASLKEAIAQQRRSIMAARTGENPPVLSDPHHAWKPESDDVDFKAPDEALNALCGTLPDPVKRAYLSYGPDFKTGYIALNNGDFETAAAYLARALHNQNSPASYIPLELATAYLNLDRPDESRMLLETLLKHHPDALPAYQMLCEIYWEQGDFDRAETLLRSIPDALTTSLAVFMLKGETLFQAGRFDAAKTFYRDFLATYGWDESIARALARTHEALDETDQARQMYQEIMGRCRGCGSHIDPLVKEKVAELSFAAGNHDSVVLELYLTLAQELPQKAPEYYAKVSRIYQSLGNETESRRFSVLAEQIKRGHG